MFARSLRTALLVAAWAILFAPGAVGGETGDEDRRPDREHVAAAVVAPTFGPDALIIGRDCQSDGDEGQGACGEVTGALPVAVIPESVGPTVRSSFARSDTPTVRAVFSPTPRAPPVS